MYVCNTGAAVARVQPQDISGRIVSDAREGKKPVVNRLDSPHPFFTTYTMNITKNKENPVTQENVESSSSHRQPHPKQPMQTNVSAGIAIDLNSSPLEHHHSQENAPSNIAIDLNMSPVEKLHPLVVQPEYASSGIGIDLNKSPPVPENASSWAYYDVKAKQDCL